MSAIAKELDMNARAPLAGRSRDRAGFVVMLALVMATAFSLAASAQGSVPLPRPRPPELDRSPPPPGPTPPERATTDDGQKPGPAVDQDCLGRLGAAGIQFETAAAPASSNAACAIDTPVHLKAVAASSRGTIIRLPEEPLLACRFAERLGGWLGELVAPLVAGRLSAEVKAVRTGPGFECRNRNRGAAGPLSAHALGLAVDISRFELSNGKALPLKPEGDERARAAVDTIRAAACGWFTTILGPGSDAAHADHMHVDIQQHGSSDRYRICQ